MRYTSVALLVASALASACRNDAPTAASTISDPGLAEAPSAPEPIDANALLARAATIVAGVNQRLAARHSPLRLDGVSFFTLGQGVPEFRRLRSGVRWPSRSLSYIIDESEWAPGLSVSAGRSALLASYGTWENVAKAGLTVNYLGDPVANPDFLDVVNLDANGDCLTDPTTGFPLIFDATWTGPFADIVAGGWLPEAYFSKCLGSAEIVAVTWFFDAGGDFNHDNYPDLDYVEQYYNPRFHWVTSGAQPLERLFGPDPLRVDLQSIATHEDGHALGLGHTGGPNPNQPVTLHRDGRFFSPEAVMNPVYLGGERRELLPLDVAALSTLYSRNNK